MLSGNFILLDAARMNEAMDEAKKLNPSHKSLYISAGNELLQSVAPYLFQFENQGEFNNYFIEKGWGDSWGVLVSTRVSFDEVYKHFRRFLMVKTEDGVELFFRFYDPRVLRIFLPTCDTNQLKEFFGPIQSFLLEVEDLRFGIKFWLQNGILQSKKIHFRETSTLTSIPECSKMRDIPPVLPCLFFYWKRTVCTPPFHFHDVNYYKKSVWVLELSDWRNCWRARKPSQ